MIILLGIASIFLFISIFMFYRAESLSREISIMKRDLSATSKEKDFFFEIMKILPLNKELALCSVK